MNATGIKRSFGVLMYIGFLLAVMATSSASARKEDNSDVSGILRDRLQQHLSTMEPVDDVIQDNSTSSEGVEPFCSNNGDNCGLFHPCCSGLTCDPLAMFKCHDPHWRNEGESCNTQPGTYRQCKSGLMCVPEGEHFPKNLIGHCERVPFNQLDQELEQEKELAMKIIPERADLSNLDEKETELMQSAFNPPEFYETGNEVGAMCSTRRQQCGLWHPCCDGLECDPLGGFRCYDRHGRKEGEPCNYIHPTGRCGQGLWCRPWNTRSNPFMLGVCAKRN